MPGRSASDGAVLLRSAQMMGPQKMKKKAKKDRQTDRYIHINVENV